MRQLLLKKIQISAINRIMFSIKKKMNSADWKARFRVEKAELPRLADSRSVPLQTEKHFWWFGGTVCATETNKLSL